MSGSVWCEEVDTAFLSFISNNISVNSLPAKAIVRKPEEDFYTAELPVVSIYHLNSLFSPYRFSPDDEVVSRNIANKSLVMEKTCLPYDMYYQVDFWADYVTDINTMTRQWLIATRNQFNLNVISDTNESRQAYVLPITSIIKSDEIEDYKRLFHSYCRYRIYVELDGNIQTTVPMITSTEVTAGEKDAN